MARLTRFEELFGDESYNFETTPDLQDVVPGLIGTNSKYASKELSRGRQAATGRAFRSPSPRSLSTRQTPTNIPEQSPEPDEWRYDSRVADRDYGSGPGDGGAFGAEGASGEYLIEQQGETGRLGAGTLGNAIGDDLAASLGIMGATGATAATAGAIGLGAPTSMLPNIIGGSFAASALNPVAALNIVGGGLVAGQMGYGAGIEAEAQGYGLSNQGNQDVSIAAFNAVDPGLGGAAELGIEGLLSTFTSSRSPSVVASETGTQTAAMGRLAAIEAATQGGSAIDPSSAWGNSDAGLVGPNDTNTAISEAFGVSPNAPTGGITGTQGTISQGLQAMGFGGTTGTMGVGPGGSTDPTTGQQTGIFGQKGLNPHASEMNIPGAPTPTVDGGQATGVEGVAGIAGTSAPTGAGPGGEAGGFGNASHGVGSSAATGAGPGDDGAGGGGGKQMRVLTPEEINENYNAIYTKIFKAHPTNQIPRTVVVQEKDNEVIGFVSGYLIDRETFYLAWGGTVSTFTQARKFWTEGEAVFKEQGVKWFQTNVENTNTSWQRVLMGMGWIPFGIKATGGKLYIEYFKEL